MDPVQILRKLFEVATHYIPQSERERLGISVIVLEDDELLIIPEDIHEPILALEPKIYQLVH